MQPLGDLNISGTKGKGLYAQAKTSADMQFAHEREKLTNSSASTAQGFANPMHNVQEFGLTEGMKVADLGAGSGHYVMQMATRVGSAGKVYAVDIQKDLLTKIKNEATAHGFDNVDVLCGDLESERGTKLDDALLDVVLISNTLFQVDDKHALLAEASRILKRGGTLVIIDWSESFGGMGPVANDVVSKEAATLLADAQGFTLSKEFNAGEHHYGIVFSKD